MQSLVDVPGNDGQASDYADWVEMNSLLAADGNTSREDLVRAIIRSGVRAKDELARELANDAFAELQDRADAFSWSKGTGRKLYPFALEDGGDVLQSSLGEVGTEREALVYVFLLAITRGSMASKHRKLDGVDPTETFERVCADVLARYWGGPSKFAGTFVVGTASGRSGRDFPKEVDELCKHVGEGLGWKKGAKSPGQGDGGLDVVAWRKFSDGRCGGLVGFAQCKTGIHWDRELGKLRPRAFCDKFMKSPLKIDPLGIYMVPCRVDRAEWEDRTVDSGGILLDRCRISQFSDDVAPLHIEECRKWLSAAIKETQGASN